MNIAIIGAGPAGLSAAERLKEKGYGKVVVFEQQNRVGGQSFSKVYTTSTGKQVVYDQGSIQPMPTRELNHLIKKAGIHFGRGPALKTGKLLTFYDFDKNAYIADFKRYYFGYPPGQVHLVFHDMLKLFYHLSRFNRLRKPGFQNCSYLDEASMPLEEWLVEKRFKLIGNSLIFSLCSTASGSSKERCANVPALYGIKNTFQMLGHPPRYIDGTYQPVREGYQSLWKAIAKYHDVRLSVTIDSIVRDKKGIDIRINGQSERFDKLIIAFPIEKAKHILSFTAEESYLAERVRYCPTWRGWLIAKNLPTDRVLIFPENYFSDSSERILLPILIPEGQVNQTDTLYSFVLQTGTGETPPTESQLAQTAAKLALHFGGSVVEWGTPLIYWKDYKPHFVCEDVKQGIYDKFEAIQGRNHTLYAGALLSGDGHAHVASYSFNLVDRFF